MNNVLVEGKIKITDVGGIEHIAEGYLLIDPNSKCYERGQRRDYLIIKGDKQYSATEYEGEGIMKPVRIK